MGGNGRQICIRLLRKNSEITLETLSSYYTNLRVPEGTPSKFEHPKRRPGDALPRLRVELIDRGRLRQNVLVHRVAIYKFFIQDRMIFHKATSPKASQLVNLTILWIQINISIEIQTF